MAEECKDTMEATRNETEVSQQEDDASSKPGYYFFKSTPQDEAHKYAPQKVEQPAPVESSATNGGHSAWNQGKTWYETCGFFRWMMMY